MPCLIPAGARHHFQASQRVLSTNSFRVSTMRSHPANTTSPCITITCPHICTYTSPLRPLQDSSTPPAVTRQPCSLQYVCHRPMSICLYLSLSVSMPQTLCPSAPTLFCISSTHIYICVCVYIYTHTHTHTHTHICFAFHQLCFLQFI